MTAGRRSRGLVVTVAAIGVFASLPAADAAAHVHGITPLRCVGVADDGANRTDTVPAAEASRLPFTGLIPPLGMGAGGFDTPACPD